MAENQVRIRASVDDKATKPIAGIRDAWKKFQREGSVGVKAGITAAAAAKGFAILDSAIAGVINVMGDAIQASSALEQSQGAIDSVFGDSTDTIEAWGKQAAESAGLSKREVNEMAAVTGAQLKGMGFELDEAAAKAIELQKRAADMAATFGGPTKDAMQAISALMRGERDPIERYGVSIKAVDVNARIAALGLDTSTAAAKKNAEAVAGLDLLFEQTSDSAGQFGRETDSLAGKQAQLNAKMENAAAALGEKLLPVAIKLTDAAIKLIPVLEAAAGGLDVVANAADGAGFVIDALTTDVEDFYGKSHHLFPKVAEDVEEAAGSVKGSAGGISGSLDDVADAARRAARHTKIGMAAIEDALDAIDARFGQSAETIIADYYDPIETRQELAVLKFEIAEAKKRKAAAKTERALAEAEEELTSLYRREKELQAELVSQTGVLSKTADKYLDKLQKEYRTATGKAKDNVLALMRALIQLRYEAYLAAGAIRNIGAGIGDRGGTPGSGYRASGGPVKNPGTYVVGEEGPEKLVLYPGGGGFVVPNQGNKAPDMPMSGGGSWGGGGYPAPAMTFVYAPQYSTASQAEAEAFARKIEPYISERQQARQLLPRR